MTEEDQTGEFPLYKMIVNGQESWLPLNRAGILYDNGQLQVSIGGLVLEAAGQPREITDQERTRIAYIADDYSGEK